MPQNQDVTLTTVLNDRLLVIPDYQRSYAWEKKQLRDLWEDIDLLGPTGTHYAGTLVLRDVLDGNDVRTSMDQEGTTLRHSEVVDGQQRLTTCLILLDRLRRAIGKLPPAVEGAQGTAERLRRVFGMVTVDRAPVPKLQLGQELRTYWVENVLGDHEHAERELLRGQELLGAAAKFFDSKLVATLADADADEQFDRLRDLQKRVTNGLRFLVYEVSSAAEVGTIFETLNERGRPLSELEKTKNYLLYLARHIDDGRAEQLADFINEKWSGIFRNLASLGDAAEDQLMRAHWLATQDPVLKNWRGTASVKTAFDRTRFVSGASRLVPRHDFAAGDDSAWNRLDTEVRGYVHSLHDCSLFLADTIRPREGFQSFDHDVDRARRASEALLNAGSPAVFRPLLLACRLRSPSDGTLYSDLVELTEKYSARVFVIAQRRANAGTSRINRLAYELVHGADPQDVLDRLRATLLLYAPDERVEAVLDDTTENWYSRRGHKYFLYEYETSLLRGGEELQEFGLFTRKSAGGQRTTEHVLPQYPDPGERGACWREVFTQEEREDLTHSLGNLVLTLDNSAYSNHCFHKKRGTALGPGVDGATCYAQGKLHQERELARYEAWTPETITQRQSELKKWALRRWNVEPSSLLSVVELEEDDDFEADLEVSPVTG